MTSQTQFRAALLDADQPVPDGLQDGQGRPAGRRYSVYRNNVAVSLKEALETAYPAVASLIGPDNFSMAAGLYLRQEPPQNPLMMQYGASFPSFLAGLEPLQSIGYLGDVALLELAMRQSYHAADTEGINPVDLQNLNEAQLMSAQLQLAPAVRLLRSQWPVLSVYQFALDPNAPKPLPVAQDVLITRAEFDPQPVLLPAGGAEFITALQQGKPFGEALARAGEAFDLGTTLSALLKGSAICALTHD